jgi:AGZA family xanthine/uracil permease-like MFS transporter
VSPARRGAAEATGAILVRVGSLMMREVAAIRWDDASEAIPAFLPVPVMPLTCSITSGIGAGLLAYAVLELLAGRIRDAHPLVLGAAFLVDFALGGSQRLPGPPPGTDVRNS